MSRLRKFARVTLCSALARVRQAPLFVRVIPTDLCNLRCRYCYQHRIQSEAMTREDFDAYLVHALRLGTGFMGFLGGEPLLWSHLDHAVASCAQRHLLTDVTTNGDGLTRERLVALCKAGLDYLNVSVDTTHPDGVSKKDWLFRPGSLPALLEARETFGLRARVNSVLHRGNIGEVKRIMAVCHGARLPLSIGYVVPEGPQAADADEEFLFSESDRPVLEEWIEHVDAMRRAGHRIIDPPDYFSSVFRFLRGESFWSCNYPKRHGWINIAPSGRIRSCTKHMDELDVRFLDLTPRLLRELRTRFATQVAECNPHCYSNCAFDGAFFARHRLRLLWKFIAEM